MSEELSNRNLESNFIIENFLDKTKNTILYSCYQNNIEIKKKYILKTFNQKIKINNDLFYKLLNRLKNINSKNIAKIIGGDFVNKSIYNNKIKKNSYFIIIEKYVDLSIFIACLDKGFNEEITKILFIQILNGLNEYIFNKLKVNHIQLNNLLLNINIDNEINVDNEINNNNNNNNNDKFNLVLSDVFLENVHDENYILKRDILNRDLAFILIELITGKFPENFIKYLNNTNLFWKIINKSCKNIKFSTNFIDLFNKLINNDSFDSFNNNEINTNNINNNNNLCNNYYEKIMVHPWFDGLKMKDIIDNKNGIYNNVIKELKERLEEIKKKIENNNNDPIEIKINLPNVIHRSNSNEKSFFIKDSRIKCVNFQQNDKNFLTFIKIVNLNNEFDFMDEIADFCHKSSNYFDASKNYFRFKVNLNFKKFLKNINNYNNNEEDEEEENEEDSNNFFSNILIKIELQKDNKNNNYQLNIYRLTGDKILFYKFYEILKKKILS